MDRLGLIPGHTYRLAERRPERRAATWATAALLNLGSTNTVETDCISTFSGPDCVPVRYTHYFEHRRQPRNECPGVGRQTGRRAGQPDRFDRTRPECHVDRDQCCLLHRYECRCGYLSRRPVQRDGAGVGRRVQSVDGLHAALSVREHQRPNERRFQRERSTAVIHRVGHQRLLPETNSRVVQ